MNTGEEEAVEGRDDALEYKDENEDIIETTFEFATKLAMQKHMAATKKLKLQNTTPTKPSMSEKTAHAVLSPEDRSKLDKIAAMVEQSRPSNKIEVLIRTNSRATKAIVLIMFKNIHGQHQWFCKPDALAVAISSFVTEFKQEDKLVQESLLTFAVVRRRDPAKGPDDMLVTTWESKDKTVTHEYPQYIAYATVMIPHESIESEENEQSWLLSYGERFGKAVKDIMQFPVFQDCYKDTLRNPNMWDTMTGNGKRSTGLTFLQYTADCKVKAVMCENMNTYIVQRDVKLLMTILFESRAGDRKYAREEGHVDSTPQVESEKEDNNGKCTDDIAATNGLLPPEANGDNNDESSVDGDEEDETIDVITKRHRTWNAN